MKPIIHISFVTWRFHFLILLIIFLVILLVLRLFDLATFQKNFLQSQGDARAIHSVTAPGFRGMIMDRNGYPLAISTSVYSVWMNPQEFSLDPENLKTLSQLLSLRVTFIKNLCERYKKLNREFVYLKRDVSPPIAKKIKNLKIAGIDLQEDYKRFYPEGEVLAHVVGFTNIDDKGQEGLELFYDQWLTGTKGKKKVIKDRLGRVVTNLADLQEQRSGNNLTLSIHRRVQYLAYRELLKGIKENHAESGSAVILDIKTGEILAMVNQPSFNPNLRPLRVQKSALRNRAVTDVFEPGSTIKAFSLASALESHLYKPNSMVDTNPGRIRVGNNILRDERNHGVLSLAEVLQISSNVGMTKVILSLPEGQLWNMLQEVGFGEVTHAGLPGERAGQLANHESWGPIFLANLGFGYGLSVTTLQLAQAYAIFGNEGLRMSPSILKMEEPSKGKRVIDANVADEMMKLLEYVVDKGTGKAAAIPGYRVAGKTGTAWIMGTNGYEKHRYVSSFVGIAPASHPRYVVAVVVHDPKGKRYLGGHVSAPIFSKIMEGTLHLLNVPPDALNRG